VVEAQAVTCACGAEATANGRECPPCYRTRLRSVHNGFTPSRSVGAGQIDPQKTRSWFSELGQYKRARDDGIQPATTKRRDTESAMRISDEMQAPYNARNVFAEEVADEMTSSSGQGR
jgi:hypothetical protein